MGNSPWVAFPQQEGLSCHSSADKIVLLGSTVGCSACSHPDTSPCSLALSFPSSSQEKGVVVLPSSPGQGAEGSALLRALLS